MNKGLATQWQGLLVWRNFAIIGMVSEGIFAVAVE